MADIIIGLSKETEIFVRDANDDGEFNEGERIGVRGSGDRFDTARVEESLGRVAISRLLPGARLHRIGAYIDLIREADRFLGLGDFLAARSQLEQALEFAGANLIDVDETRLAELSWRAVDVAREAGAIGLDGLHPKNFEILCRDDRPGDRLRSASLILEYLSVRQSIHNVEGSAGPGRARMLEDLNESASGLETEIAARGRRMHVVLVSGTRSTVLGQINESGTVFSVGDTVRYRDPDSGEAWERAFIITGFEIRAGSVTARGEEIPTPTSSREPHRVDIDYLAHEDSPAPDSSDGGRPASHPRDAGDGSDWGRLIARLGEGARRFFSFIRE